MIVRFKSVSRLCQGFQQLKVDVEVVICDQKYKFIYIYIIHNQEKCVHIKMVIGEYRVRGFEEKVVFCVLKARRWV